MQKGEEKTTHKIYQSVEQTENTNKILKAVKYEEPNAKEKEGTFTMCNNISYSSHKAGFAMRTLLYKPKALLSMLILMGWHSVKYTLRGSWL